MQNKVNKKEQVKKAHWEKSKREISIHKEEGKIYNLINE